MTDLRTAAQQALEAMSSFENGTGGLYEGEFSAEIAALRAALAEPEDDALTAAYMLGRHDSKWCPIHQHYKWCEHNGGVMGPTGWEKPMQQGCQHCNQPLYTAPPQRKPLTREQAIALWADKSDGPSNSEIVLFARAVERAHGIV